MRRALPLLLVLLLAACGGGGKPSVPAGYESHDLSGGWSIVWKQDGTQAHVEKDGAKVGAGGLHLRALGPEPGESGAAPIPQVAVEIEAPAAISDYTVLLDGSPIELKSGGLTQKRITVYGAPASSLSSGRHVVVAAARAGGSAAATAWTFTVR
jgi:hypothetical protein